MTSKALILLLLALVSTTLSVQSDCEGNCATCEDGKKTTCVTCKQTAGSAKLYLWKSTCYSCDTNCKDDGSCTDNTGCGTCKSGFKTYDHPTSLIGKTCIVDSGTATAAGAGILTILLLWVLSPLICIVLIVVIVCCVCKKNNDSSNDLYDSMVQDGNHAKTGV